MTGAREEPRESVSYIHYLVQFKWGTTCIQTLIDSRSKVNAIHPTLAKEIGLSIRSTEIGVQKIDSTLLDTYGMVVVAFSMMNKVNQLRFFKETFLMANVSLEVVLGMLFLTLSGANVDFLGQELRWRIYTIKEALPTTRRVELVGKKKFAVVVLDLERETFVVYVASLSSTLLDARPYIFGLIIEEAPTKVPAIYSDFADVFSPDLVFELSKHTGIMTTLSN